MHLPRTREEALGAVEAELRKEQAAALGRVGQRLATLLEALAGIEQQLAAAEADSRAALVRQHAEVRREAEKYRWYLIVQREALGLYQHAAVEQHYPTPRAISE